LFIIFLQTKYTKTPPRYDIKLAARAGIQFTDLFQLSIGSTSALSKGSVEILAALLTEQIITVFYTLD